MPYSGSFQSAGVIQHAYNFNNPLKFITTNKVCDNISLFQVDREAVVLDAVKLAEDHKDCIIIRLYESFGSHVQNVSLKSCYGMVEVSRVDGLERPSDISVQLELKDENNCTFSMKPFELICLCIRMK